jgi:hypothetical protein
MVHGLLGMPIGCAPLVLIYALPLLRQLLMMVYSMRDRQRIQVIDRSSRVFSLKIAEFHRFSTTGLKYRSISLKRMLITSRPGTGESIPTPCDKIAFAIL